MSHVFIEIYLDEDVNVLIAELLRRKGFSATTARDCEQLGKSDKEQIEFAVSQKRALVTHNRVDFERLVKEYFLKDKLHYGVIIAVRRSPKDLTQRIVEILNQINADEIQNQIRYI